MKERAEFIEVFYKGFMYAIILAAMWFGLDYLVSGGVFSSEPINPHMIYWNVFLVSFCGYFGGYRSKEIDMEKEKK